VEVQVQHELSCFCTFDVPLEEIKDPFFWWSKHEGQFPIVAYLARACLGIHGSQIKI
jgi:hypothetical protein